jgi:uncharacterized protein HemY
VNAVLDTLKQRLATHAKVAVKRDPSNCHLLSSIGRYHQGMKQFDKAQRLLEKALEGSQDTLHVHVDDVAALICVKVGTDRV